MTFLFPPFCNQQSLLLSHSSRDEFFLHNFRKQYFVDGYLKIMYYVICEMYFTIVKSVVIITEFSP